MQFLHGAIADAAVLNRIWTPIFASNREQLPQRRFPMSAKKPETPEDFAARALEMLEQSYAYYSQPPRIVDTKPVSESYYEYVKAA